MKNIIFLLLFLTTALVGRQTYDRTLILMGTRFDITVIADSDKKGEAYIDLAVEEIQRIERLISSWDANSQTSAINLNAGIQAVKVDAELMQLIERAIHISQLTDGAFDISFASMDRLWRFDGSMTKMPSEFEVRDAIQKIGFKKIVIDKAASTVFLKDKGMKIGFGAIGKGYAADKAKELLKSKGVIAGIINAAGDLNAWGTQENGQPWKVAIINPLNRAKAFAWLPIDNSAIVTSGDYEKFVKFDGIRYAHIIDPRTGYPSRNIVSVTVMAPSAEIADALATSIFVMGAEVGVHFIDQLPDIECIIVDESNKIITSKGINVENEK